MADELKIPRGAQWAADIFSMFIDGVGAAYHYLTDGASDRLSQCQTPEEVREYAYSIQRTQPAFADELIHAANMSDGLKD